MNDVERPVGRCLPTAFEAWCWEHYTLGHRYVMTMDGATPKSATCICGANFPRPLYDAAADLDRELRAFGRLLGNTLCHWTWGRIPWSRHRFGLDPFGGQE